MSDETDFEATDPAGPGPEPRLMSVGEVAGLFNRTARTIRNWVRGGHLRPVRVGRSMFFRTAEIEALLGGLDADQ